MTDYGQHFSTLKTPQVESARSDQKVNGAGGFVFTVDKWSRLDRFLVLGADGGTYYASEKALTVENARVVQECASEDGARTVARIVDVSYRGLAPKNDAAIFALAMCASESDSKTRKAALDALPKVCRIGTHLFHFVRDTQVFRGFGRGLRDAVAKWYAAQPADKLANQVVKYRQRDGWSHRDLLRLAHPKAPTPQHEALFRYVVNPIENGERDVKRGEKVTKYDAVETLPPFIWAFEEAQKTDDKSRICAIIREHGLTHEMLPTQWKNHVEVWDALLLGMPMTALIRNLGKMTEVGLLKTMSNATRRTAEKLADRDVLRKARVHPMSVLVALKTYQQGHGEKGSLKWEPQREIVDALDAAFYLAFETVEPTGKNMLLGLDVSGSMTSPIAGMPLTCHEASAALAMVTARTEKNWHCFGFTAASGGPGGRWGGGDCGFTEIAISPKQRLDDVIRTIDRLPMGGTDCSLPMRYATKNKFDVDAFAIYTDNETWHGNVHPFQALREYRQQSGRAAKLCVLAMTPTAFTIADPNDAGMLDIVGMSADVPAVIANFVRGVAIHREEA
jgi:60 kDa SS-A/Ro ribonucleoprotein